MQYAIELARGTGARLTVAHVVDHTNFILLTNTAAGYLETSRKMWVDSVTKKLHELVARENRRIWKSKYPSSRGNPTSRSCDSRMTWNAISSFSISRAREYSIALFSVRRRSVVVRLAHMPVLSVPVAITEVHSGRGAES